VLETVQVLKELGQYSCAGCPDFTGLIEPFTKVWQAGGAAGIPKEVLQPLNRFVGANRFCW